MERKLHLLQPRLTRLRNGLIEPQLAGIAARQGGAFAAVRDGSRALDGPCDLVG